MRYETHSNKGQVFRVIISASLVLLIGCDSKEPNQLKRSQSIHKNYLTFQDCTNEELKSYKVINEYSTSVVIMFCKNFIETKERDERITLINKCKFNYDKASDDGYSHREIMETFEKKNDPCLQ
jgi:hypothetical protein